MGAGARSGSGSGSGSGTGPRLGVGPERWSPTEPVVEHGAGGVDAAHAVHPRAGRRRGRAQVHPRRPGSGTGSTAPSDGRRSATAWAPRRRCPHPPGWGSPAPRRPPSAPPGPAPDPGTRGRTARSALDGVRHVHGRPGRYVAVRPERRTGRPGHGPGRPPRAGPRCRRVAPDGVRVDLRLRRGHRLGRPAHVDGAGPPARLPPSTAPLRRGPSRPCTPRGRAGTGGRRPGGASPAGPRPGRPARCGGASSRIARAGGSSAREPPAAPSRPIPVALQLGDQRPGDARAPPATTGQPTAWAVAVEEDAVPAREGGVEGQDGVGGGPGQEGTGLRPANRPRQGAGRPQPGPAEPDQQHADRAVGTGGGPAPRPPGGGIRRRRADQTAPGGPVGPRARRWPRATGGRRRPVRRPGGGRRAPPAGGAPAAGREPRSREEGRDGEQGCTAAQGSWRKPGSVKSAVRHPPPGSSAPSRTLTPSPPGPA